MSKNKDVKQTSYPFEYKTCRNNLGENYCIPYSYKILSPVTSQFYPDQMITIMKRKLQQKFTQVHKKLN